MMAGDNVNAITSPEESLTIIFHGGIEPLQLATNSSTELTCEKAIENCMNHIQAKIYGQEKNTEINGPKYLITFGLVTCPEEKIWLPLNHVFKKSTEKSRMYKFRVRFRPPADQFTDSVMCEYLFLQTLDDFLKGPLGKNEKLESKTLFGLLVIALLFPTTLPLNSTDLVNQKFKSRSLNIFSFTRCFSKEIAKRFISQPFVDHYWVYKTIKGEIHGYKTNSPPVPLGYFKKEFYRLLMEAVPDYCFEEYSATSVSDRVNDNKIVTLNLGLYKENNKQDALYYGEVYQCSLKDIYGIKLMKPMNLNERKWLAEIDVYNLPPKILMFEEEGVAESFVSMIQGYYKLCVCYNTCLCMELQMTGSKIRSELKSFGPLSNLTAQSYLEDSRNITESDSAGYIIHESLTHFGQYKVVCRSKLNPGKSQNDSRGTKTSLKSGVIECLADTQLRLKMDEEDPISFGSCAELKAHLKKTFGPQVPLKNFSRLADINEEFQSDIDYYGSHTRNEDVQNSSSLPVIKEDLQVMNQVPDKNPLVKKYEVNFNGEQMMLVELQSDKGEYAKAFREGLEKLYKLYRIKKSSFLQFYNLVVDAKFSVLMEYVPHKDVLTYICNNSLKVAQKVHIMNQIINIFSVMDKAKIYHGNLRLRKFMAFNSQEPNFVTVKLGDPGISSYFDTLPLDHPDNIERIPWLSPERRKNLQKITSESEVYALGTTLCELLYRNDQFHEELRLGNGQTMLTYLSEHKHLPQPPFLADTGEGSASEDQEGNALVPECKEVLEKVWSMILLLWAEDEAERPTVQALLILMKEVQEKTKTIEADTVIDKMKHVAYDMGMTDKDLKTDKRDLTLKELVKKFDCHLQQKKLLQTCIDVRDFKEELGKGHFGAVYKGRIRQPQTNLQTQSQVSRSKAQPDDNSFQWTPVAIKRIKIIPGWDRSVLYKEVNLACSLNHPNIVKLLYLSCIMPNSRNKIEAEFDPVALIMEFMNGGNLTSYAKKYGDLNTTEHVKHMIKILLDVAQGMVYLSGKGIVHRDLAARNVLLHKHEDGSVTAKVSDFGLARAMEENYRFYKIQPTEELPFAWMPPECLVFEEQAGRFSSLGDVWSFGTLIWESFSKGKTPWTAMPKKIGQDMLLHMYKTNWRLPKGDFMNEPMYTIMKQCWDMDQQKRPPFVDLVQMLKKLL